MNAMEKLESENRQHIVKLVSYRVEEIAARDKLDLKKSADHVTAMSRAFAEDRELYDLYRTITNVPV